MCPRQGKKTRGLPYDACVDKNRKGWNSTKPFLRNEQKAKLLARNHPPGAMGQNGARHQGGNPVGGGKEARRLIGPQYQGKTSGALETLNRGYFKLDKAKEGLKRLEKRS